MKTAALRISRADLTPTQVRPVDQVMANYNAAGYGVVRFKKSTRKITMECWRMAVNTVNENAKGGIFAFA